MKLFDLLQIFVLGTILSAGVVFLAVQYFPKLNLLDFPERYGLKRAKIPYPGGLALFPLFAGGLLWFDVALYPVVILLSILTAISFADDRHNLPVLPRLITQIGLAVALILLGIKISQVSDPLNQTNLTLPLVGQWIITIGWCVFLPNALNWFDGLKGLCVGTAGIGFLALGVLSLFWPELFFDPAQITATKSTFWLAGICLGAFPFFFRGRILLGDTGSQTLGFLLAVFSIISGAKIATTLIVLAIPILDTIIVMLRRIFIDKKSPFKGDLNHFHHQLAQKFGEPKSVLLLCGITTILGALAAFLHGFTKMITLGIVGVFILVLIVKFQPLKGE
ncbi:hypothetical protein CSB37_01095 [bacterium DOLZORAL124_38_8]|nr:MAG: hypothetical protein CSB37_01095 [bacterium DOLZORAL124_38_8]